MNVRAKFTVQSITRTQSDVWDSQKQANVPQEVQTIRLMPVYGNSPENKEFFASTPCGTIELAVVRAEAAAAFELNKSYYVDFSPAQ